MPTRLPRRPTAFLAGWLFGHAALQVTLLGVSALGVRIVGPLPLLLLSFATLCGLAAGHRVLRFLPAEAESKGGRSGSLIVLALWSYVLAVLAQLVVIAWLRPVYDLDGLYYHLPAIHEWVRAGRVHWIASAPDLPYLNGYPMATEVVGFLFNQLFGHDRLVDAANLSFWPLAFSGLIVLARSLGASRIQSLGAGAAIGLVPLWVAGSVSAYVDVAFAASCIALLAVAAPLVTARGREATLLGYMLAPALGLCAATKGLGIPFSIIIFLALAVARLLRQHFPLTLVWRPILFAPLGATVVAGYWPLRNLLNTGNPIHPVGLRIASWQVFEGVDAAAHAQLNLPHWLWQVSAPLRPLVSWTQPDAPIVSYGAISGLGYLWLLIGLPASIVLIATIGRLGGDQRWHAAFLVGISALLFALQPANWWGRFTLWIHALGLPATASLFHLAGGYPGAAQRALRLGLATLILGIGGVESMTALRAQWRDGLAEVAPLQFVSSAHYFFAADADAYPLADLLAGQRIARSSHSRWGTLLGGALKQPLGVREIRHVDANSRASDLAAEGFQWLIWDVEAAGPCPPALSRHTRLVHVLEHRPGVRIELRRLFDDSSIVQGESRIFKQPRSRAANSR